MPNGDVTVGTWDHGGNCVGTMTYKNGDEYSGCIVRYVRSGQGATKYKDGATFDGVWRADIQDGAGLVTFHNGDQVEGAPPLPPIPYHTIFPFSPLLLFPIVWCEYLSVPYQCVSNAFVLYVGTNLGLWDNGCCKDGMSERTTDEGSVYTGQV